MLLTGSAGARSLEATGVNAADGDEVALHFSVASPLGQQHFRTQATIVRVLEGGNGLGVRFLEGLDPQAFKMLLEFAVAAGTAVPDELPEPEVEELDNVMVEEDGSVSPAPLRDGRISEDAASKLTLRISAATKRTATRVITGFSTASHEFLLIAARDAGTNAIQSR